MTEKVQTITELPTPETPSDWKQTARKVAFGVAVAAAIIVAGAIGLRYGSEDVKVVRLEN